MKKFIPINKHLLVEPIENKGFIATPQDTYEEKGVVLALSQEYEDCDTTTHTVTMVGGGGFISTPLKIKEGDIVYFDSWMAAKFPDSEGKIRFLVQEEHVRAIERDE